DTEDEANGHRNSERQHESGHSEHKGEAKGAGDTESNKQTNEQANAAPHKTENNGLEQELIANIAAPRPDGHTNADFARALGHRDEHDIHDPDATHRQRDRRDAHQ